MMISCLVTPHASSNLVLLRCFTLIGISVSSVIMLTQTIPNPAWLNQTLLMVLETSSVLLMFFFLETLLGFRSHFAPAPACSIRCRLMYLFSSAERSSMEQGHKVSEHATPLARNFSSLGKDVESGNIPQVRVQINLPAS